MARHKTTSIPEEHSLWFRPMRQLLDDGKPVGSVLMLTLPMSSGTLPFCVVSQTGKNRLIAWPIFPPPPVSKTFPLDHITLEFPSKKMHATGFASDGKREVASEGWRLYDVPDTGVAFWFRLAVRHKVIESQDLEIERWMKSPTVDADRRKEEFLRYSQRIQLVDVRLPPGEPQGDYVLASFFIVDQDAKPQMTASAFLCGGVDAAIDNWPDGTEFVMQPTQLTVGEHRLLVVTASPPGKCKQDVILGFPSANR